jgi:hypothetical protein
VLCAKEEECVCCVRERSVCVVCGREVVCVRACNMCVRMDGVCMYVCIDCISLGRRGFVRGRESKKMCGLLFPYVSSFLHLVPILHTHMPAPSPNLPDLPSPLPFSPFLSLSLASSSQLPFKSLSLTHPSHSTYLFSPSLPPSSLLLSLLSPPFYPVLTSFLGVRSRTWGVRGGLCCKTKKTTGRGKEGFLSFSLSLYLSLYLYLSPSLFLSPSLVTLFLPTFLLPFSSLPPSSPSSSLPFSFPFPLSLPPHPPPAL